jgi:iron complex transport system substrate-binding protein
MLHAKMRTVKLTAVFKSYAWLAIALWLGFSAQALSQTRIVTTSPAMTELIFQLGHGQQIVGASQFSDYPEAARTIPRIGTLFLPSVEKILAFSPDWVFVDREATPKNLVTQLEKLKMNCLQVSIQSVSKLFEESHRILKQIFNEGENQQVLKFENQFSTNQQQFNKHYSFILLAWPNPMYAIGRHTFLSDLLTQLGGENLLQPNISASYPQVSEEWLIKNHPEVLFILGDSEEQKKQTELLSQKIWPRRKTKVIYLPSEKFARTSFTALEFLPQILNREL